MSRDRILELEAKLATARKALEEVKKIARFNQSTWGQWMRDHAEKSLAALGDAQPASAEVKPVPEGWQLVPIEPTTMMDFAGAKAAEDMLSASISKDMGTLGGHVIKDYDDIALAYANDEISSVMGIYKAMLTAAPTHPQQPRQESEWLTGCPRCGDSSNQCDCYDEDEVWEGHVVVTKNPQGQIVAVTRQDDDGRVMSMIAESEPRQESEIAAEALALRKALIGWRKRAFPGTDQEAVIAREFPAVTSLAAQKREQAK